MICDVCKAANASVFLTQIVEGKMQKVNLCEACSKERGVTDPTAFALADFLQGLGGGAEEMVGGAQAQQKCGNCGLTQMEFKKTGRLGCSECYEVFAESIGPMLSGMHKGISHTGKVPERLMQRLELERTVRELHEGLRAAVASEDYEEAARLRDRIKRLEQGGSATAAGAGVPGGAGESV